MSIVVFALVPGVHLLDLASVERAAHAVGFEDARMLRRLRAGVR